MREEVSELGLSTVRGTYRKWTRKWDIFGVKLRLSRTCRVRKWTFDLTKELFVPFSPDLASVKRDNFSLYFWRPTKASGFNQNESSQKNWLCSLLSNKWLAFSDFYNPSFFIWWEVLQLSETVLKKALLNSQFIRSVGTCGCSLELFWQSKVRTRCEDSHPFNPVLMSSSLTADGKESITDHSSWINAIYEVYFSYIEIDFSMKT